MSGSLRGSHTRLASLPVYRTCRCERDQAFRDPDTGETTCLACGRPAVVPSGKVSASERAASAPERPARGRSRPGSVAA